MGKVRVRHGDNEIEVDGSDQFVQKQLERFYERIAGAIGGTATLHQRLLEKSPPSKPGKELTPAEFYRSKGKTDGVSQLLIFAKYLEQYENLSDFTRKDINRIAKDVKLSKDVHPQYFTNAVKQGLLRKQGQKYSLTLSAEETLASMKPSK
jgi:hypothetical protein